MILAKWDWCYVQCLCMLNLIDQRQKIWITSCIQTSLLPQADTRAAATKSIMTEVGRLSATLATPPIYTNTWRPLITSPAVYFVDTIFFRVEMFNIHKVWFIRKKKSNMFEFNLSSFGSIPSTLQQLSFALTTAKMSPFLQSLTRNHTLAVRGGWVIKSRRPHDPGHQSVPDDYCFVRNPTSLVCVLMCWCWSLDGSLRVVCLKLLFFPRRKISPSSFSSNNIIWVLTKGAQWKIAKEKYLKRNLLKGLVIVICIEAVTSIRRFLPKYPP